MMTRGFRKTDLSEMNKYNKYKNLQALKLKRIGNRLRSWSIRVVVLDYSLLLKS
jgi:hypothetical protein